ncbi:hypothetical protein J2W42_000456 [Rhizobium tibeticum]|uniref:Uncharacterized protein n=1 Tax=Rhizobium tibeticum TaxID=501024 RepID=A0A1H8SSR9_9HYPH|nr:hypothetical protein [Rhizobium tibeticum]SEI13843.1 hypothetical protein RTCCBAU85039_4995 [Rhizobium tibeticum]SEO81800.1 hypothetical protein SAMN05216228_102619 [Rhizobium tibeticum]
MHCHSGNGVSESCVSGNMRRAGSTTARSLDDRTIRHDAPTPPARVATDSYQQEAEVLLQLGIGKPTIARRLSSSRRLVGRTGKLRGSISSWCARRTIMRRSRLRSKRLAAIRDRRGAACPSAYETQSVELCAGRRRQPPDAPAYSLTHPWLIMLLVTIAGYLALGFQPPTTARRARPA